MMQKVNLKQRIIGAIVLLALAIIFLPMLLQESRGTKIELQKMPPKPAAPKVQVPQQIAPIKLQSPQQMPATTPAWSLQLGAFANEKNAKALLAKLQKAGYPAYAQSQNGQAGKILRVYVGPEVERNKLQAEASKLEQQMQLKGSIVPYQAINTNLQEVGK